MYKFVTLVCFTLAVQILCSAAQLLPPVPKPEEFASEEGCYIPQLDLVIPYLESYAPPAYELGCLQYNCQADGWVAIVRCSAIGFRPGCRIVTGDLLASYPECCPRVECN